MIFFIFLLKIQISICLDLPTKEELEEIKKPELPKDFFSALIYASSNVLLIEAGSFYIEQCSRIGELKKAIVNPVYKWFGPNFRTEITGHHFIKLENGDLLFIKPTPKDSGVYYCRMSSSDIEEYFEEYVRYVIIFVPPMWIKEIFLHFLVLDCGKETLEIIMNSTKMFLCKKDPNCLYQIKLDKCSPVPEFLEMMEARICVHQHLYESFVNTLPQNCGIECCNNQSLQELDRYSGKTIYELRLYMKMMHREKTQSLLQDMKTTVKVKPICMEGYELYRDKVCIPCDVGKARTFDEYNQKCKACDLLSYSSVLGNVECSKCELFKVTSRYGSTSSDDCRWFYQSSYIILLSVPFLILLCLIAGIIFSWFSDTSTEGHHKTMKLLFDCCCYEYDDEGFKAKVKKENKLMKAIERENM